MKDSVTVDSPIGNRQLRPSVMIVLILLLGMFGPISTDMYLSALPTMVVELSTNESTLNITMYGFILGMALSILLLGPLTDRFGRRVPLILSMVEYTATTLACAFVEDIHILIVLRILQSIGSGLAIAVSTALVKDCFNGATMGRVLTLTAILGVLGPILSPVIGAGLITLWGWRSTFIAPAMVSLLCLVISFFMPETLPHNQKSVGSVPALLRNMGRLCMDRGLFLNVMAICIPTMAFMAYLSISSYIYVDMFGLTPNTYTAVLAITLVISVMVMMALERIKSMGSKNRRLGLYLIMGIVSAALMLTVGHENWFTFFIAYLFICSVCMSIRPWGFEIVLSSREGDSGALSSLLNFMFFMVGCIGMLSSTLPIWPDHVTAMGSIILISMILFGLFWALMPRTGTKSNDNQH
ncbi:MAG: MFS transporter [Candidatus Methanomethylophilaceae archaeon]|nr:MFS transporter [Candidatus Methanomethylophilaceae archaeon]